MHPLPAPHFPFFSRIIGAALLASVILACSAPQDADKLIAKARQYQEKGDTKAAIIVAKNAVQSRPEYAEARLLLGQLHLEAGDAVSAEKELRRAATLGTPAARYHPLLAKAMLAQGQFEQVLALSSTPPDAAMQPTMLALRANALLALGKIEAARTAFEAALAAQPDLPGALLGLAKLAIIGRKPELAATRIDQALARHPNDIDCLRFRGDLHRALGKNEPAMATYAKILTLRPGDAQAHADVTALHIEAGQFDAARVQLHTARRYAPTNLLLFYTQALLDFREGKNAAAHESLQQILRSAPEHMPSVLLSAAVQLALGAPEQANQHLKKFLAVTPEHPLALKLAAVIALKNGDSGAALAHLAPLLRDNKAGADILALAGEANMRARHFSRAAEYFERASALDPKAARLHTALGISRLGSGDNARAIADLEHATSLDPTSPRANILLVMTLLRSKQLDKALAAVNAMEHADNNPLVHNLKGGVYLARHDAPAARLCFEQAIALDPAYLPALDNLAQMDLNAKQPELAKQRYAAALAKAPKNIALMTSLSRLAIAEGNNAQALGWLERASYDNPDALTPALRLIELYLYLDEKHKALASAQKLLGANPDNSDVLALYAKAQYINEAYPAALESYVKLGVLLPSSAPVQLQIARLQLAADDEDAALASAKKALTLQADLLDAQVMAVRLQLSRQAYAEAVALAKVVQQQRPDSAAGYKLEGDVMLAQGQALVAVKSYERAFSMNKVSALLIPIHDAQLKAGKAGEADARLTSWIADHPTDLTIRLYLASTLMNRRNAKAAIAQFEAILKLDPKNVIALNDLAWASLQENNKDALNYAERAHQLAGNNPIVIDTLAYILLDAGNTTRALPLLHKASALAPGAGEIRHHLALGLLKSGDKPGARKELEQVLATDRRYAKRSEVKALLASLQ